MDCLLYLHHGVFLVMGLGVIIHSGFQMSNYSVQFNMHENTALEFKQAKLSDSKRSNPMPVSVTIGYPDFPSEHHLCQLIKQYNT